MKYSVHCNLCLQTTHSKFECLGRYILGVLAQQEKVCLL